MNGLVNNDSTCYLNCIIQSLVHLNDFSQIIEKNNIKRNDALLFNFYDVTKNLLENDNICIDIKKFKKIFLNKFGLTRGKQEDAHCVLLYLIDHIHTVLSYQVDIKINLTSYIIKYQNIKNMYKLNPEDQQLKERYLNYKNKCDDELLNIKGLKSWKKYFENNYSELTNLFYGQYFIEKKCVKCDHRSCDFEIFNSFGLSTNGEIKNIYECIEHEISEKIVKGWNCKKCSGTVLKKTSHLWKLPKIFIIYFKRFEYKEKSNKINKMIYYNININLNNYINKYSPNKKKNVYTLKSVINHYGSINNGHYTSLSYVKDKWYNFDDTTINESNNVVNKNAYILFYVKNE